jgi:hypothetical protein
VVSSVWAYGSCNMNATVKRTKRHNTRTTPTNVRHPHAVVKHINIILAILIIVIVPRHLNALYTPRPVFLARSSSTDPIRLRELQFILIQVRNERLPAPIRHGKLHATRQRRTHGDALVIVRARVHDALHAL